jgi:hypothetical protein
MVNLSLDMVALRKDGSRLHRRSSTRLGRQPRRGTLIVRRKSQHVRLARAVMNENEVLWRTFLQMKAKAKGVAVEDKGV